MEKDYRKGLTAAVSCSVIWGFLPIYWKTLLPIPSSAIIFYRIFWVGVVAFLVSYRKFGWKKIIEPLKDRKNRRTFFLAGVVITTNWSIYIWAVNSGNVIQSSIGYYIEPLLISLFGILFFSEKLTKYNFSALLLATAGVIVMIVHSGQVPTIAFALAITFATYSVIKKKLNIESVLSLFYETLFLVPAAVAVIIFLESTGRGAFAVAAPYQHILLALTGVCTALPLGLFNSGARFLPLVTLGITQYISPSIALVLGIFAFKEPFDGIQFMAVTIIWVGLFVFTLGEFAREKERNKN